MNLEQLQRAVFEITRQPLTPAEKLRPRLPDGRSIREIADALIKPNDRLTSFERLQIYGQQYWFRLLASLCDDFPGLGRIVGEKAFEKIAVAYLRDCPSESFTLRNLGSRLETWLRANPAYIARVERLATDMVRLEWADIEAFDGPELPRLSVEAARKLSGDAVLRLQPHLHLLDLAYPVDELLFRTRGIDFRGEATSNAVLQFPPKARTRRSSRPRPRRVYLAVYRLEGTVYFKRLTRDAFALLEALKRGNTLAQAIEMALVHGRRDPDRASRRLQQWFQNWSSLGWFAQGST